MDRSMELARLGQMWKNLKSIRSDMLREFHVQVKAAREARMEEFVGEVRRLMNAGVKKGTIASQAGVSRTTLDRLMEEYQFSYRTYSFEVGFGRNVTLVGILSDTGGFPELEGEQKIRFRIYDGIATADDVGGAARDFLDATYGPEAHAYAVQERVKGWDDPVPEPEPDAGGTAPW